MPRRLQCFWPVTRSATLTATEREEVRVACTYLETRGRTAHRDSRLLWRPYTYREFARLAYALYIRALTRSVHLQLPPPSIAISSDLQVTYSLPAELHSHVCELEREMRVDARDLHRRIVLAFARSFEDRYPFLSDHQRAEVLLTGAVEGTLAEDVHLLSGNPLAIREVRKSLWF